MPPEKHELFFIEGGYDAADRLAGLEVLDGVLVVRAGKTSRGKRVLAALLREGKVESDRGNWLRSTRGAA